MALVAALVPVAALSACGGEESPVDVRASGCRIDLHGKGGDGGPARIDGEIAVLSPTGNGEGWGAREWRYASDEQRTAAIAIITAAADAAGCERVAIHGFSNGASMAAALACSGETLDGRLRGVVVDDPVPDDSTSGCARAADIPIVVYWTGALADTAPPGTDCAAIDWTCAGGKVRSIDEFAADLEVAVTPSPNADHRRYDGAPEPVAWLALDAAD